MQTTECNEKKEVRAVNAGRKEDRKRELKRERIEVHCSFERVLLRCGSLERGC